MSNHTSGPWFVSDDGELVQSHVSNGVSSKLIVVLEEGTIHDMHLIAAAPALLVALKFAKSAIKSGEPWSEECERIIDGAIRRATPEKENIS